MRKLEIIEMQNVEGGQLDAALGVSCALTVCSWLIPGFGPIGSCIFGPTCVGTAIGYVA